jgi:hypothetical protein
MAVSVKNLPLFESLQGAATQQAEAIFNPILEMLARRQEEERQAALQQQQANVAAVTKAYGDAREPTAQMYNAAIGQSTAVEEAIAKRLRGEGGEAGADFARKLAEMGAPQADAQATENAKRWTNSEGVGYTLGMNDVSRLISRAAGARDYLERQPGIAQEESQAALLETLRQLSEDYGSQRDKITAEMPGKILDLQQGLYEREWKQREYIDQVKEKAAAQKAANEELYLKQKLTMQQLGQTAKLKALDRAFKARQAALDRDLKYELEQMNQSGQDRRDNPTAVASGPNMKFNPDGTPNPNYDPATKPTNKPQTGARSGAVFNTLWSALTNGGNLRDRFAYSQKPDAAINAEINRILAANKVPQNERAALRRMAFKRLNGIKSRKGDTYKSPKWGMK